MGSDRVTEEAIKAYVNEALDGIDIQTPVPGDGSPEIAWGDTFFIYDPDRKFEGMGRMPFATIVTKYYPDDSASKLNREGVFRLNIGIGRETFLSLFGADDVKAVLAAPRELSELDTLLPHPIYGGMHWVCVVNPSKATFETLKPLLVEACGIARARATRREGAF